MKHTKFIAFLLSVGLLISVTGCADNSDSAQSSKTTSTSEKDTSATQSTEATKSDVATSDTGTGGGNPDSDLYKVFDVVDNIDNTIEDISELREMLLEHEFITDVQVFSIDTTDESKNAETQILEGKMIPDEMIVRIYCDDNKSYEQFVYGQ